VQQYIHDLPCAHSGCVSATSQRQLWCTVIGDLETSRMRRPWPALGHSATGGWGGNNKYKMLFLKYVPVERKISWLQPADDGVHSCTHPKCVKSRCMLWML